MNPLFKGIMKNLSGMTAEQSSRGQALNDDVAPSNNLVVQEQITCVKKGAAYQNLWDSKIE